MVHFLFCLTEVAIFICELKVGALVWYCLQRMGDLMLFFQNRLFQSAMLIPSVAFDICSEKILGDGEAWVWIPETDTTVFSFTEKCKGSYLALYTVLSCNNSFLTETQVSVDPSLPFENGNICNPFFFFYCFPPCLLFFSIWM